MGEELYIFLNNLWLYISNHKDLIYTFIILIASIYIPLFIIIIELLKKKNNKLDLALFFEKKVNIKVLIFLYVIIFVILLFWNTWNELFNFYYINVLLFLILIIPIFELVRRLIYLNSYFLLDTKTIDKERIDFISELDFKNIEIWLDIFKLDSLKDYNFASKFTEILFKKIKEEIWKIAINNNESEKYILVENIRSLLISYNELKYDSIFYSFFDEDNLDLFFNINKEIYKQRKNNNYIWISNNLSDILKNNLEKLKNDDPYIFIFYKILKEHIEENKKDLKYIKELLWKILNLYFNSDILLKEDNILNEFPYKINLFLLKNKNTKEYEKVLHLLVFNKTLNYIRNNIINHYSDKKITFNNKIDNILKYWFWEFEDIITFSDILYMLFVPYWNNRAESIINGKRTFWYISRVKIFVWGMEKNYINNNKDYENTINKFKELLPWLINKEELEKLLKEFEEIIKENKMKEKYILRAKSYRKLIENLLK